MKSEPIFFDKRAIMTFLGNHGKEKTKDYEFSVALIMHRFCERHWGKDCWIGLIIKPEYRNSLPSYNSERQITLEEIVGLFRNGIREDSPVDFYVGKRADTTKVQGMVFQVKRFGIGRDKKDTDALTVYLNSFPTKYSKTNANLLICLDDGVKTDIKKLREDVDTSNFPFNRIIFTWGLMGKIWLVDCSITTYSFSFGDDRTNPLVKGVWTTNSMRPA